MQMFRLSLLFMLIKYNIIMLMKSIKKVKKETVIFLSSKKYEQWNQKVLVGGDKVMFEIHFRQA